jgi:CRISPR system Cascade subunit CasA
MNLLIDPVFRIRTRDGISRHNLPELLALLGEDCVESLPGLQRHQEDAFHVFLCYLAGAVLDHTGRTDPRQSPAFWLEGLRAVTRKEGGNDDSAWTLVVDDPTKPAFMQPPATSRAVFAQDYKPKADTPDSLDVMQTAKNHDVKAARAQARDPEAWVFALISLQTTIGYMGRNTYGISRMNGGSASRPFASWLGEYDSGKRFVRDTSVFVQHIPKLLQPPYPYQHTGKVLLWLESWDGDSSYSMNGLAPCYIEIARRIRLQECGQGYRALSAPSIQTRVAADGMRGNVGDPWIPINKTTNGAWTLSDTGLTPQVLRDLIFGDGGFQPAVMQEIPPHASSGWVTTSVLVRGNCTTDGFHEARIRIPERVRPVMFGGGVQRDRLATLSKRGLDAAKTISDALRWALYSVLEGGPKDINFKAREVSTWVNKAQEPFAQNWNPRYFDWLWNTLDAPDEEAALRPWFAELRELAQETLNRAMARVPMRHGRSYRSRTKAQGAFTGSLYMHFPQYMEANRE